MKEAIIVWGLVEIDGEEITICVAKFEAGISSGVGMTRKEAMNQMFLNHYPHLKDVKLSTAAAWSPALRDD